MGSALREALALVMSGDAMFVNIVLVTAQMALLSACLSLVIGTPIGLWLGAKRSRGRHILLVINRALMGLPPVVCGLVFYLLFCGVGPLRRFGLLFTIKAMVIAQVVLITPLVVGQLETHAAAIAPALLETTRGLELSRRRTLVRFVGESRYAIVCASLLALGRALAEVGAVSMVGGAISWQTNVMTTAIMQETNRGHLTLALALGLVLLAAFLIVSVLLSWLQRRVA